MINTMLPNGIPPGRMESIDEQPDDVNVMPLSHVRVPVPRPVPMPVLLVGVDVAALMDDGVAAAEAAVAVSSLIVVVVCLSVCCEGGVDGMIFV